MNTLQLRLIIIGILFLFIIISGIWLSKLGRPLNNAIFSIHKLIAIACIILTVVTLLGFYKNADLIEYENIFLIISSSLLLISFITGGLLSFDKFGIPAIILIHKISPILLTISILFTLYIRLY